MYTEVYGVYGKESRYTYEDIVAGRLERASFDFQGFRLFGNRVLEYFYNGHYLDRYLNLFKYTHWAAHNSKISIEYNIEYPKSLYPLGSYISSINGRDITFQPVESLPIDLHTPEQKNLVETEGRVFFHEIKGETLTIEIDEFLRQLRAPVPELTTMLHYIVEDKIVAFDRSNKTDKELLRLWAYMEDNEMI